MEVDVVLLGWIEVQHLCLCLSLFSLSISSVAIEVIYIQKMLYLSIMFTLKYQ